MAQGSGSTPTGGENLPTDKEGRILITGAFEDETTLRGATELRERVLFVGFVNEKNYESGAFGAAIQLVANPNLFKSEEDVEKAVDSWLIPGLDVLNLQVHYDRPGGS